MLIGCGIAALGAAAGCGASQPPKQLLDARAAYQEARAGQAPQLSPASLHDAQLALQKAERAFEDDGDEPRTRDLAYVAERKAELADVEAATIGQKRAEQLAAEQAREAQQAAARNAQGELEQTREQLATADKQLQLTGEQLQAERQARAEAERRAQDALDKLVVANAAAVKVEERGTVITLPGSVLFASGKSDLLPTARARLDQVAEALKDEKDHQIVVEGHTDSRGSDSMNLELSQRRADSVRDYLASHGVPTEQLKATGVGEGRPLADNGTAEGRATNRRVEIVIQPLEQQRRQQ